MENKMLIDAAHPEETRVVVVQRDRIEEFDFEAKEKKQLKGNIYLAKVARVEPSLQAAFVDYGGNRHGFLAFSEIHPDYYQIPVADRQALLEAEAEANKAGSDDEQDGADLGPKRALASNGNPHASADVKKSEPIDKKGDDVDAPLSVSEKADASIPEHLPEAANDADEEQSTIISSVSKSEEEEQKTAQTSEAEKQETPNSVIRDAVDSEQETGDYVDIELVGSGDALEEVPERRTRPRIKQYKIQEVIKRRQIILVQVVKEERGNKGAALTTYLSLAGRYSVLMPNTDRGGGISRKITNQADRKRLRGIVADLDVAEGMGIILRTAGATRTKPEIRRDFEYLIRLWENVRDLTLKSSAPTLVYEEGSLIKRSIRDLYNKDIEQILVAGNDGYREAKDFMRMLMPSHAKNVQRHKDLQPIFAKYGVEEQLDAMFSTRVTLKSGGYIIINQTEALVSIDVNSGRSTRESSIEETALSTNIETAEEVARQLRLRDLAGLIVIDFIDMNENRNNRIVERKLKDCLRHDRARIQVGRISHFGLLEMSRQRIRSSMLENTMELCPNCEGTGYIRDPSSSALHILREIEEYLNKGAKHNVVVRTKAAIALFVLNSKRDSLSELEQRFGLSITFEADETLVAEKCTILRGTRANAPRAPERITFDTIEMESELAQDAKLDEAAEAILIADGENVTEDKSETKKRRKRGRKAQSAENLSVNNEDEAETREALQKGDQEDGGEPKKKRRRRGRRGGVRERRKTALKPVERESDDGQTPLDLTATQHQDTQNLPLQTEKTDLDLRQTADMDETVAPALTDGTAPLAYPLEDTQNRTEKAQMPQQPLESAAEAVPEEEASDKDAKRDDIVTEEEQSLAKKPRRRSMRKPRIAIAARTKEDNAASSIPDYSKTEDPTSSPPLEHEVARHPVDKNASEQPITEAAMEKENKPVKSGWWQRRSFF